MSTRSSSRTSNSAAGNLSRSTSRTTNRNPGSGVTRTGTTIAFTAPATITDSGNGLGGFIVGQRIEVRGSGANSRTFVVATVAAGALTVRPQTIVTAAAGPLVTISAAE